MKSFSCRDNSLESSLKDAQDILDNFWSDITIKFLKIIKIIQICSCN